MTLQQVAAVVGGHFQTPPAGDAVVDAVTIDSRTARPGELFIAIRGDNFDGHEYIAAAFDHGAVGAIADRPVAAPGPVIVVDDTIAALGRLAAWYRRQLSARVIAITGSAGKTTTRRMMHDVLSGSYRCRQAPKSFNNHIGVPLTMLSAEADDAVLLLELGANAPGEIAALTQMARPDIAVVTLIGPAHLAGFGSLANILTEKASIASGLTDNGTLYLNGDQPELVEHVKKTYPRCRVVTFGTTACCDVIGADLRSAGPGGSLGLEGQRVDVPLPGRAALMTVLTVWSVCRDLEIGLSDFRDRIGRLKPVSMRLEVLSAGSVTILNDCYNANPASMANALASLASFERRGAGRRVFIAGTMGELGPASAQLHEDLGRAAAEAGVELLLAVGAFAAAVTAAAAAADSRLPVAAFETTGQLCDNLHKYVQPDDIVLVKGSRLAGLERAVATLKDLFG